MQVAASKTIPFYGNGPYCYSNATSMLLAGIGEKIPPSEIEVYTAVGLGAFGFRGRSCSSSALLQALQTRESVELSDCSASISRKPRLIAQVIRLMTS